MRDWFVFIGAFSKDFKTHTKYSGEQDLAKIINKKSEDESEYLARDNNRDKNVNHTKMFVHGWGKKWQIDRS